MVEEKDMTAAVPEEAPKKKQPKVKRDLATYPGKFACTIIGGEKGEMVFDPNALPEKIQGLLPAFAVNHKLGDATSGKTGLEAEKAVTKTWEGMMEGNWSVRIPAQPKVNVSDIKRNFENLSAKEQKVAAILLEKLGIK